MAKRCNGMFILWAFALIMVFILFTAGAFYCVKKQLRCDHPEDPGKNLKNIFKIRHPVCYEKSPKIDNQRSYVQNYGIFETCTKNPFAYNYLSSFNKSHLQATYTNKIDCLTHIEPLKEPNNRLNDSMKSNIEEKTTEMEACKRFDDLSDVLNSRIDLKASHVRDIPIYETKVHYQTAHKTDSHTPGSYNSASFGQAKTSKINYLPEKQSNMQTLDFKNSLPSVKWRKQHISYNHENGLPPNIENNLCDMKDRDSPEYKNSDKINFRDKTRQYSATQGHDSRNVDSDVCDGGETLKISDNGPGLIIIAFLFGFQAVFFDMILGFPRWYIILTLINLTVNIFATDSLKFFLGNGDGRIKTSFCEKIRLSIENTLYQFMLIQTGVAFFQMYKHGLNKKSLLETFQKKERNIAFNLCLCGFLFSIFLGMIYYLYLDNKDLVFHQILNFLREYWMRGLVFVAAISLICLFVFL